MHWLKSAILAIIQKSANWLDWPCPVTAALQNRPQDLFSLLYLNSIHWLKSAIFAILPEIG